MKSPSSVPIHLLALKQAAQPAPADDAMLRSAIVNVANYYLRMAAGKTPAEMEAMIWQHDSVDGVDHGDSCAAFASLTLELAAQVVGQQSWVTGGTSYPWPLHKWADVRVEPNPASPGITSILQDAEAHHRWHSLGDGYEPLPGDWVLFNGHVEVVTKYSGGVLYTVGGDSLPNFSVNAHQYGDPLDAQGVVGFVDNGELPGTASEAPVGPAAVAGGHPATDQAGQGQTDQGQTDQGHTGQGQTAIPGASATTAAQPTRARPSRDAAIPGMPVQTPGAAAGTRASARQASARQASARQASPRPASPRPASPRQASPRQASPERAAMASVPGVGIAGPAGPARQAQDAAAIPGLPGTAQLSADSAGQSVAPASTPRPAPPTTPAHVAISQQAFISEVAPGAIAAQRTYGVPASVTIAQAIEESGWGQSRLATQDHNLFGIKGTGPAGSDPQATEEYENGQPVTRIALFRMYHNVAESINDHGKLLATSGYYTQAMAARQDPNAFATALTGVYATDPDYGAKLIVLMQQYDLYRYDLATAAATPSAATPGRAAIPGVPQAAPAPPVSASRPAPSSRPKQGPTARSYAYQPASKATPSIRTMAASRGPTPASWQTRRTAARTSRTRTSPYQQHIPPAVQSAFTTMARVRLVREEPLYRDVASQSGIRWELLAACDWMQCEAQPRYSPVHGEKLGTVNPDGTIYHTKSAALEQCADDLVELARTVYEIDLTAPGELSVRDLASAFAAFRWGGLLKLHHTSAMEFPYSVAGLTVRHIKMRWPKIAEPNTPDKPGARFRMPFGAVPVVLGLNYQATV
jgi:flagellum-specific peptidoglycan hydrolase FlgJ